MKTSGYGWEKGFCCRYEVEYSQGHQEGSRLNWTSRREFGETRNKRKTRARGQVDQKKGEEDLEAKSELSRSQEQRTKRIHGWNSRFIQEREAGGKEAESSPCARQVKRRGQGKKCRDEPQGQSEIWPRFLWDLTPRSSLPKNSLPLDNPIISC